MKIKIKAVLLQLFMDKQRDKLPQNPTIENLLKTLNINIQKDQIFSINTVEANYNNIPYKYIIIHRKNGKSVFFRKIENQNNFIKMDL